MIKPSFLQIGDKIAFVAPARKISHGEIVYAIEIIESWGLEVVFDNRLFNSYHQFGGTDAERTKYLQEALDSSEIKAILSVRGGYGITRIIDDLDFTLFKDNPKWVCGYSDVTALLSHIANLGFESIHSSMPMLFERDTKESVDSLRRLLFGEKYSISAIPNGLNRKGIGDGILIGGNLSMLNTLISTSSDYISKGKILFLEDIDEYLYNIDRMLIHLKRAGKFEGLEGIIVGHMTDMKDNIVPFGFSVYQIIQDCVKDLNIPLAFGFPIGHEAENLALPVGRVCRLVVEDKGSTLSFED